MRGKVPPAVDALPKAGITPAYAGKSPPTGYWTGSGQDHPRIRGEKKVSISPMVVSSGSPPHTRGKAFGRSTLSFALGITPAYAGKSPPPSNFVSKVWDHPRIRGEKLKSSSTITNTLGSPPHTRGKGGFHVDNDLVCGITPAYAGKRPPDPQSGCGSRDHPRIRGEKTGVNAKALEAMGSPPHTRGKEDPAESPATQTGITPAYAGKSRPARRR